MNLPPNGQSAKGTKPAWMALFEESVRSGTLKVGIANRNGVIWCPPNGTIVLSGSPFPSAVTIYAPPKAVTIYAHSKEVTDTPYALRFGDLIIDLFVRRDRQEEMHGDLLEMFNRRLVPTYGIRVARWMYVWQTLRSVVAIRTR